MSDPQLSFGRASGRPAPDDYVEFVRAGTQAKGQFECTACGYQVVTRNALPRCSRCGGSLWERSMWSPFSHLLARLGTERPL